MTDYEIALSQYDAKGQAGHPSALKNEAFKAKVYSLIVKDKQTFEEVWTALGIPRGTWMSWYYKNTDDFRILVDSAKHERMLRRAEDVIEDTMYDEDKKLKLDAAKFTAETLGRTDYARKTESEIQVKPVFIDSDIAKKNGIDTHGEDRGGSAGGEVEPG